MQWLRMIQKLPRSKFRICIWTWIQIQKSPVKSIQQKLITFKLAQVLRLVKYFMQNHISQFRLYILYSISENFDSTIKK